MSEFGTNDLGLPRSIFDPERVRNVLALGIEQHPDQERVYRFLKAGAGVFVRHEQGKLHFGLRFTPDAPLYAAMRADVWGTEPGLVAETDRDETLSIIKVPVGAVGQPPQG